MLRCNGKAGGNLLRHRQSNISPHLGLSMKGSCKLTVPHELGRLTMNISDLQALLCAQVESLKCLARENLLRAAADGSLERALQEIKDGIRGNSPKAPYAKGASPPSGVSPYLLSCLTGANISLETLEQQAMALIRGSPRNILSRTWSKQLRQSRVQRRCNLVLRQEKHSQHQPPPPPA